MIKITDINITFDKQRIIESSSIEIERGKLTAIIGKSGSGKTSILYLVGLLTSYDKSSNYIFDNNQINLNSDSDTSAIRNTKIGYIFQENNILNYLTVYENFELILTMCKKEVSHELVESLLKLVKLDIPIDRLPRQLSGGQRQRLCIALALAKDPDLLILDEPTSNLDTDNTNNVMSVLKDIAVNLNKMILISTHVEEVEQFCDMTYNIVDKKVVLKKNLGTTTKLTKNYKDSLTGGFRFNLYALIIKRYLNHYKKLYLMIIVISLLGVNAIVGTNVVGKIFIDNKADSILEKMDNEMFIASNGDDIYPKFTEMLPSISESKVQEIFEIEEFIEIYYYSEIVLNSIKINDEIIEGHIIIQPIYTNDNDIYIDRHIFETYNCSTISFEIDAVEYELNVNKSLSLYEQNKYGFGVGIFIKVPYDIFYSMTEFSNKAFVARYDDYKSVDVIKEKLQSIDIDIKISYDYLNYNSIINIVEKYEQTMQFFNIIMSVIYISYLLVVYRKLLDQRKDSFSILKTNGLSNKEMLYYLIIEMMFIVGVIVFNSFIIVVVLNTIFGNISIISYLGKTTLYLLVTLLVSILSCSGKLIFKDSVYLLKH